MNATAFTQQVKAMSDRLVNLYQGIDTSSSLPLSALSELGIASERLEVAAKMLYQQNQKLLLADQIVEAERQRYQELLEFIPDACLLTDAAGRIQEANQAAARLLNCQQSFLIGRSLNAFVTYETRQQFQTKLHRLQQRPGKQEWQVRLQPHQGVAFHVTVLVEAICQEANQPLTKKLNGSVKAPEKQQRSCVLRAMPSARCANRQGMKRDMAGYKGAVSPSFSSTRLSIHSSIKAVIVLSF
ncbi:MAG: PAS domain-containing protein [Microcoleus sp. SIO2G3]|nr:PAS domain-containing protein [Microcoleus sp. SIO2G3]